MTEVVTERYRLGKIDVEIERVRYIARYTAYYLHVQHAPRYIVVFIKRQHLRFVLHAAVCGQVYYLADVANERGTEHGRKPSRRILPKSGAVRRAVKNTARPVVVALLDDFCVYLPKIFFAFRISFSAFLHLRTSFFVRII